MLLSSKRSKMLVIPQNDLIINQSAMALRADAITAVVEALVKFPADIVMNVAIDAITLWTIGVQAAFNVHIFFKITMDGGQISGCKPGKNLLLILRIQAEASGNARADQPFQYLFFHPGPVNLHGTLSADGTRKVVFFKSFERIEVGIRQELNFNLCRFPLRPLRPLL